ncbi:MAG: 16S rRNA (adenine(1518)-N(6)/adenine(1519)-N(6))-dimethyltransferase RsmA [Candidatus Komeilibacteria bacterium]|nr:16S rRNA (adenine(1518)-N(6)/adenine(1519)-N(6))-dimethyltransferase RsmA [Candidatus Komeilibacteria bacterium]
MSNLLDQTKLLLKKYNLSPRHLSGQNFLIDESVLDDIMQVAAVRENEAVLEIGPGLGILTERLLAAGARVVAIENDQRLEPLLKVLAVNNERLSLRWQDALQLNNCELQEAFQGRFRLIANIPYQITAKLLHSMITSPCPPTDMVLMVQKEVAERIIAPAGELSRLAISVQFYGQAEIIRLVDKSCFYPSPKVDSAIIKITIDHHNQALLDKYRLTDKAMWGVIRAGFAGKRKKLVNNLSSSLGLDKNKVAKFLVKLGYKETVRAQEIEVEHWISIAVGVLKSGGMGY